MGKFRVVKQLYAAPSASSDPNWAARPVYVAKLSGSADQLWEFDDESDAYWKMMQLSGSDSTGRKYKVIEI